MCADRGAGMEIDAHGLALPHRQKADEGAGRGGKPLRLAILDLVKPAQQPLGQE